MDQLFWTQSWKAINFTTFFEKLSAAVTTGQAEDEDNEEDGNDENDEDEESDINSYTTGSSQENQQEIHSESTLQEFFCNHPAKRESLDQLQLVHGNVRIQDLLCHASGSLIGYRTPTRLSTPLRVGTFRNDRPKKTMCNGGIVLSNPGAGRSQKPGNLPIISSEVSSPNGLLALRSSWWWFSFEWIGKATAPWFRCPLPYGRAGAIFDANVCTGTSGVARPGFCLRQEK